MLAVSPAGTAAPSSLLKRTLTILLTPRSCMVTPYNTSAMEMVRLLWVMTTNWL